MNKNTEGEEKTFQTSANEEEMNNTVDKSVEIKRREKSNKSNKSKSKKRVEDKENNVDSETSQPKIKERGNFHGKCELIYKRNIGKIERVETGTSKELEREAHQTAFNETKKVINEVINRVESSLKSLVLRCTEGKVVYVNNSEDRGKEKRLKLEENAKNQELKFLRLDVNLGFIKDKDNFLVDNLDQASTTLLLKKKVEEQIKYLLNMTNRVNDSRSCIFVTGDLNSGKSTFCNSLLRKKILPEDQQPCTSVFCEVNNAKKNNCGVEEIHAVLLNFNYNVDDESTYEIFPLCKLEELVYDNDKYSLLKIFLLDNNKNGPNILNSGSIDVRLIDCPGLNIDLYQTTQLYLKQEEIDLVIFVVSSENHFTLSAKEFLTTAAKEKSYVFIIANKFDTIKNQSSCKNKIQTQIKNIVPTTYKNKNDFVYFLNSSKFLSGSEGPEDDDSDDYDYENENRFKYLEESLKKFIFEKRLISKLLPAKNYLLSIINDLEILSLFNIDYFQKEIETNKYKLNNVIHPKSQKTQQEIVELNNYMNQLIDSESKKIFNETLSKIHESLDLLGYEVNFTHFNLKNLYLNAKKIQIDMLNNISNTVNNCEEKVRNLTIKKIDSAISDLKFISNNNFLEGRIFNSSLMFSTESDFDMREFDTPIGFSDFFDPNLFSFFSTLGIRTNFLNIFRSNSMLLNSINPVKNLLNLNMKNVVSRKQLTLDSLYLSTKVLSAGILIRKSQPILDFLRIAFNKKVFVSVLLITSGFFVYYLYNDIPKAFVRNQIKKIKKKVNDLNYPQINALRVSNEFRNVLNSLFRQMNSNLQFEMNNDLLEEKKLKDNLTDLQSNKEYFEFFYNKIQEPKNKLNNVDLERN